MSGNLSLERGLAVLEILAEASEALGVREIARRLGLSAAATQRILNTLAEREYVRQETGSRRYVIGCAVLVLAKRLARHDGLVSAAEPELRALAELDCFNGFLGVRRKDKGIYLLTVQSSGPVVIRSSPGEAFSLHATALGKALLMGLDADALTVTLGEEPYARLTPRTVTDRKTLLSHLKASEAVGYTTSLDENFEGLISVGAPVRDSTGAIRAAISIAYPRSVGPRVEIAQAGESIMAAAERISHALGFRSSKIKQIEDADHAAE